MTDREQTVAGRHAEDTFRGLLESAPDAMVIVDASGEIVLVNTQAEKMFGYRREELFGERVEMLVPDRFRGQHPEHRTGYFAEPHTRLLGPGLELYGRRRDGSEFPIEIALNPLETEDGTLVSSAIRDISERQRLEALAGHLGAVVESSADAIISKTVDGTIVSWNPGAERLYGYNKAEAVGHSSMMLVPAGHEDEGQPLIDRVVGGDRVEEFESVRVRKDGSLVDVSITMSAVRDAKGNVIGASTIARDVSDHKRMEVELRASREEALAASAMKSAFLANMSHEIRTPLNGVIGMSDLLLDSSLDREQREHARLLKSAGETLVAVVDAILDFSKIEAGAMLLECVELDLLEAVEDACDLIADSAERRGIELTVDLDPELPEIVCGDAVRLRQMMTNLLSNAVKFTSDGDVTISLRAIESNEAVTNVRFEVADTGIGIEPDRLEQMFEPFMQEDDSTTRRFGGTGLGLAIVKQLVEMMDGEVGVTSVRGRGSTFWFTLPLERGKASRQSKDDKVPLAGHRLLVVDDNEANRHLMVQLARRWELDVTAVPDGPQALDRLRDAARQQRPFDCAALDMHMPRMDGIELAHAIHRDVCFPTPALVMLTSTTDQRRDARDAGIDIHVTKPLRRSRLQSALAEALGIQMRRNHPGAEHDPGRGAESSPLILIAEDNDINQILAVSMLKRRGYRTQVAGDGREALAMLDKQGYAAVLMDCQMPELSGYDTTRELRHREQGRSSTPVIAMTANALRGDREKCIASGMDDYLPKPLKPEDLEQILSRWAPKTRIPNDIDLATQPPPAPSPLDLAGFEVFLLESGDAAATVVDVFARQTPDLLAQMRAAIQAADAATLREKAHKLKGSCLSLSATQMAGHCKQLEDRAREGTIDGAGALVNQIETAFAATLKELTARANPGG
jgi:two-component system sensor histidine kinase/response regulator